MSKKPQPTPSAKTSSALYYAGRILQRLTLGVTVTLTGIYWVALVTRLTTLGQNNVLGANANALKATTLKWAVFTAVLSLLLLTITRFRKYEKPLIVDGVVIALFCFVSALVADRLVLSPF